MPSPSISCWTTWGTSAGEGARSAGPEPPQAQESAQELRRLEFDLQQAEQRLKEAEKEYAAARADRSQDRTSREGQLLKRRVPAGDGVDLRFGPDAKPAIYVDGALFEGTLEDIDPETIARIDAVGGDEPRIQIFLKQREGGGTGGN